MVTKNPIAAIEALRDRQIFMAMPLETKLRNTCPGCGCRLIEDDWNRALELAAEDIPGFQLALWRTVRGLRGRFGNLSSPGGARG